MVSKDLKKIIKEIKIKEANAIKQKEIQSFSPENLQELEENDIANKKEFAPISTKIKMEEIKNEIKEEIKNEIKEEPKNENKIEKEEESKEKTQKKKKKHNKKKAKKSTKIFEIPKDNPYRNLFDFKEVTKSRFQDNSIFRIINNWEEKEWLQTNPPTKDIDELFPSQTFPQGEIQPYLK